MKHEWASEQPVCLFCGTAKSDAAEEEHCPVRKGAPPRAVPTSIFSGDISFIGERAQQIRAEEWKATQAEEQAASLAQRGAV